MDELAKRLGSASIDTKSLVSVPVARMGSVSSGFSFARASPAGAGHSPALDFSAHQTSSKPAKDKRESDVYMTQNGIEKRSESPGTFATASPAASFSSTFSYTPSTTKTFALGSVGKSVSSKSSAKPVIGSKVKKSVLNRQVSAFASASASASAVSDAKDFLKEQGIPTHEEDDLSDL